MHTRLRPFLFAVFGLLASHAHAQGSDETGSTGEVALSNDTVQLRYITGAESVGADRGRLYGTFFLSEERDIVLSAGWLIPLDFGIDRLTIRFGPQAYAALLKDENNDVMTISLGGEVRYVLIRRLGLAVSGQAFYAPDILTFGSADNLTDLSARIELNAAPRLTVFGGMRWFEFDLTEGGGTRTLQEELFAGIGYRF